MSRPTNDPPATTSLDVRGYLAEALRLDLVGPWPGHALVEERLPGWVRPSNWYLTGFLIPSGSSPQHAADADEDDDVGEVPEKAGLGEENNEDHKSSKKGFFPSSMGISFLISPEVGALDVAVSWGDYTPDDVEGDDGKTTPVWQRTPRKEIVEIPPSAKHWSAAGRPGAELRWTGSACRRAADSSRGSQGTDFRGHALGIDLPGEQSTPQRGKTRPSLRIPAGTRDSR